MGPVRQGQEGAACPAASCRLPAASLLAKQTLEEIYWIRCMHNN